MAWNELWHSDKLAKSLSYSALISLATTRSLGTSQQFSADQIRIALPEMPVDGTEIGKICPQNAIQECLPGKVKIH